MEVNLMFTYKIIEKRCRIDSTNYTAYGIEVYKNSDKIKAVHDVFIEKILAEKTVELFTREQPDMLHFDMILESILQDPEYMLGVNYGKNN